MSTIDETDYVSSEQGVLVFKDPKQYAKFELGVRMAIYQWEELNLAGGLAPSAERREDVSGVVLELFEETDVISIDLIDEQLWHNVVDDLDPEFENDSGLVTGDLILKMYRECRVHDYSRIDEMYRSFQEKQLAEQVKRRMAIEGGPNTREKAQDGSDPTEQNDLCPNQGIGPNQPVKDEEGFDDVTK